MYTFTDPDVMSKRISLEWGDRREISGWLEIILNASNNTCLQQQRSLISAWAEKETVWDVFGLTALHFRELKKTRKFILFFFCRKTHQSSQMWQEHATEDYNCVFK